VIAGGTGAIGLATARRLARLGAQCVLLYGRKSAAEAEAMTASLPAVERGTHWTWAVQLTDSATLHAAAAEVQRRCGVVHILVNCAGHTQPVPAGDLDALTDELIDTMMQVNFRAVLATVRAFRALLEASGDGLVVNVSSIAGFTGTGSNLAYVGAKAATDVVTGSLARVLAPKVRVLAVSPGVVDTGFVPGRGADFNAKAATSIPLKRVGTADDVAAAIQACATTLRYATGARFVVDGGRHL